MPSDPLIGRIIDNKYRIDAEIGAGGMATIYRATRLKIGDVVAIKILHAELLREPKFAERFQREAQAAARLKHPNVVTIHDFGVSEDDVIYLVMELVEGPNLRTVIKDEGPMTTAAAAEVVRQVCAALTEAHRRNIIHRDIKPANIAVDMSPDGMRVKVLDFGIASLRGGTMMTFTQTGTVMGTPAYMSPEQCLGEELDGRSDIYSLGIVLFEMLAGVVPFNSPTATAVVMQHVQQTPPALRVLNVSISAAVEDVVLRVLAKRREDRPQTARDFAEELSAAVAGVGPRQAGYGTDAAADRNSPSQFDRTMVQSPFRAAEKPDVPLRRGPNTGVIAAVAVAAVLGAIWFGVERVTSQRAPASQAVQPGPTAAPRAPVAHAAPLVLPQAGAVARTVHQFYGLWDAQRLADAYGLLSERYRSEHPYQQWERSHQGVVRITVQTTETGDPMTVGVVIESTDRSGYGTVDSEYRGTWSAVREGGDVKLDRVALRQTR